MCKKSIFRKCLQWLMSEVMLTGPWLELVLTFSFPWARQNFTLTIYCVSKIFYCFLLLLIIIFLKINGVIWYYYYYQIIPEQSLRVYFYLLSTYDVSKADRKLEYHLSGSKWCLPKKFFNIWAGTWQRTEKIRRRVQYSSVQDLHSLPTKRIWRIET